jgi:methionyl-tRNA formyltransferase
LRIALIGQAAFAEKVLEGLHSRGEEIVHVYAPPDPPSGRADPLKIKAQALGLPLSQPKSFRGEAALEQFESLQADLAILAFVTIIVPEPVIYAPKFKSICFHPSLLPRHRGASAINWAIIQGDSEAGVTVFWPDKGIDTGPILLQKRAPIGPGDTTGSLYFERLFPLGVETVLESVELIKAGKAPAIVQDESLATYDPICRDEHAQIDFNKPAREIYNLVRGCDPQPGAYANLSGKRLRLYEPAFEQASAAAKSGTITSIDERGMAVALGDATMIIKRVRLDSTPKKVSPRELAVTSGELVAGARLD